MNSLFSLIRRLAPLLPLLTLLVGTPRDARGEAPSESQVKGAYLYNFTKFVTWPDSAFAHERDPFQLCLLGQDPFGAAITALTQKTVGSHPIAIRHLTDPRESGGCHLLFVAGSEEEKIPRILEAIRGKPVLTVGDTPEFASRGGMIHFTRVNDTVRFAIHQETALNAGLRIHATLLQVGHVLK
ncbi:MAG: YfiR family protein [Magnetococcales bacterium]|nr:YfiR family protein [Magnetococcales bacterium]